ncbi:putative tetratricopeptide-like helical domain superfamily [Helianthus anomalus]
MALGRVFYDQQLFKESLVCFKRAAELQPTNVRLHFRSGNFYHVLGNHTEAKSAFISALDVAEAGGNQWGYLLPQIHVNLGIALEFEGMVISACEHYREAAILCPTHFRALKLLGSALLGVGEYKAAFQKDIDLKPGHVDALYNLGGLYMDMGRYQRASEVYNGL